MALITETAFLILAFSTTSFSANCTRSCRFQDSDDRCWSQSLRHFTQELIEATDHYVRIVTLTHRWKHFKGLNGEKYEKLEEKSINNTLDQLFGESDSELLFSKEEMYEIVKSILNKAKPLQEKYEDMEEVPPSLRCPMPCDYKGSLWVILFWVMFVITVLCVSSIALYLFLYKDNAYVQKRLS